MTRRLPRLLVTALVMGVGISQLVFTLSDWHLRDAGAYWEAANRLRDGQPLYPALTDTEASEVYRYAPWFAWLWVPLTFLPRAVVMIGWSVVLLAASALALVPLARERAWLAVAFFAPILIGISAIGNVQPLIVAGLVMGLERRSGPLWIGLAASLKAVPILFAVTYLGRGQWLRAFAALAVTAILVLPMVQYDLSAYPTSADAAGALINVPVLYAAVVAIGLLISLRLARSRFAWLASGATVVAAIPRLFVYDVTFLMAAVPDRRDGNQRS